MHRHRLKTLSIALLTGSAALAQPAGPPTPQLVARLGRMTPQAFAALLPEAGVRLCARQADGVEQVLASLDNECQTVTAAQVTPALWRSELRGKVDTRQRVSCTAADGGERCTTPPVRNEPPGGRLWFFTGTGAARRLTRVVTWHIDF